ncbi:site-specific DNA-methyltransferase [candidate division KSB1 bacterium]|nr:site-specific DNA-methyltransferase [candidate division KSB1 bacterium]
MKTSSEHQKNLLTIKDASLWASQYLNKEVTESNISYLIQYGAVRKVPQNGAVLIKKQELQRYYDSFHMRRKADWKEKLGDDLDWHLSFDYLREADTTKHVHRLHPYKGKFIPQLVGYFIDGHTDEFKRQVYFKPGDILLDPFCGSGTTLVQTNELGIHAVGIDISEFNAIISNTKVEKCDFGDLEQQINKITHALKQFVLDSHAIEFEQNLLQVLNTFNATYFPSPEMKIKFRTGEVHEKTYGRKKGKAFRPVYERLIKAFDVNLSQARRDSFLDKWYFPSVREEIDFVFREIQKVRNPRTKTLLAMILSRTIRSCRATTHSDLATLREPMLTTYYCSKHKKICKPLFTITRWWNRYCRRLFFFVQYWHASSAGCFHEFSVRRFTQSFAQVNDLGVRVTSCRCRFLRSVQQESPLTLHARRQLRKVRAKRHFPALFLGQQVHLPVAGDEGALRGHGIFAFLLAGWPPRCPIYHACRVAATPAADYDAADGSSAVTRRVILCSNPCARARNRSWPSFCSGC